MKVNYLGKEFEVLDPGTIIINTYDDYNPKEYVIKGCDKQYRRYIIEDNGKEYWICRTEVAEPNNKNKFASYKVK